MRLLFATSEMAPWVKTGGLGDVASALPHALHQAQMDVRVLLPAYPSVRRAFPEAKPLVGIIAPGGELPSCRVLECLSPAGLPLWLLDCPQLFDRPGGPYQSPDGHDWGDNPLRFALLSRVAALLGSSLSPLDWRPDIVHGNDWQTGLIPAYLNFLPGHRPRTVMTIHNLAFQGNFDKKWLPELALPWEAWGQDGVEFHGHLSFLKAGLFYCDRITTVSPTYAREICHDDLGFGLSGLLRHRVHDTVGILNGIDTEVWNPATDPSLGQHYDVHNLDAKAANKAALQRRMGLEVNPHKPLLGVVSRLTYQKGVDWLLHITWRLVEAGMQLVVLGAGDKGIEAGFASLVHYHPGAVGVHIGYDEALSHQIEAGADLFVMPSRFEPCGLNQMYSLRYGTPPIVRPTGGLADTVVDCHDHSLGDGSATGFVMYGNDAEALLATIHRAVGHWHNPGLWRRIQENGMHRDFSWQRAAQGYLDLYRQLL